MLDTIKNELIKTYKRKKATLQNSALKSEVSRKIDVEESFKSFQITIKIRWDRQTEIKTRKF